MNISLYQRGELLYIPLSKIKVFYIRMVLQCTYYALFFILSQLKEETKCLKLSFLGFEIHPIFKISTLASMRRSESVNKGARNTNIKAVL